MRIQDTAEIPIPNLELHSSISHNYHFHFQPFFIWHKTCQKIQNCECKKKNTVGKKKIWILSKKAPVAKDPAIFSDKFLSICKWLSQRSARRGMNGNYCCNTSEQWDPQQVDHWPQWGRVALRYIYILLIFGSCFPNSTFTTSWNVAGRIIP